MALKYAWHQQLNEQLQLSQAEQLPQHWYSRGHVVSTSPHERPRGSAAGLAWLAEEPGHERTEFVDLEKAKQAGGAALGGSAAGLIMYGLCKSKCPGAKGGIMENIPGAMATKKVVAGAGKLAFSAANGILKTALGVDLNRVAPKDDEEDDDADEEEEPDEKMAQKPWPDDPKILETMLTDFAACRSNCKVKAMMAAAAGAAGGAMAMSAPLNEWTLAPGFAMMDGDRKRSFDESVVATTQRRFLSGAAKAARRTYSVAKFFDT